MSTTPHTAAKTIRLLEQKEVTSLSLTQGCISNTNLKNATLNAFCGLDQEGAIESAKASDARRKAGKPLSPLDGIPIAIKDIICTNGLRTTCGSKILESFIPPYDAHVIENLRSKGLIILGKTNMDEFAMGGSTETSIFGSTRNPWDISKTAGGSSGGSAAAVAGNLVPWALGTDTGGSIRQPASYCGICGLKPTYGRISRYGVIAFASSLDQVGPMAQTVEDIAWLFSASAGHDARDSTSLDRPVPTVEECLRAPKSPRIGVVREHLDHPGLDAEVRASILAAIEVYRSAGSTIVDISLPNSEHGIPTYYVIAPSEASSNLSRYDGAHYGYRAKLSTDDKKDKDSLALIEMYCKSRAEGFGSEVKRRIMLGTYALSSGYYNAYYLKALKVRRLIREDFDRAFQQVDVLLGPTAPSPAFGLGEKIDDPVQMYLVDLYTVGANLAGLPAVSIPCGFTKSKMPIGIQLQAAPLEEARLLQIAHWFQTLTSYQPTCP